MAEYNETLLHRWFEEVWNKKREDAINEMLAADSIGYGLVDPQGNPVSDSEGFKALHRAFISAYPDLHVTVEDTITEGDKIVARCIIRATHDGDGLGIAPTNQPIDFTGVLIVRVKDGKIVEAWNEFNFMKMYSQVGVLILNF